MHPIYKPETAPVREAAPASSSDAATEEARFYEWFGEPVREENTRAMMVEVFQRDAWMARAALDLAAPASSSDAEIPLAGKEVRNELGYGVVDFEGIMRAHLAAPASSSDAETFAAWLARANQPEAAARVVRDAALEEAALVCDIARQAVNHDGIFYSEDSADVAANVCANLTDRIRALKSTAPTTPDSAILATKGKA